MQKQGKNRTYSSTEETSEFLRRSLKLPDSADLDRVNTSYQNGVLTLLIAKHEVSLLVHTGNATQLCMQSA